MIQSMNAPIPLNSADIPFRAGSKLSQTVARNPPTESAMSTKRSTMSPTREKKSLTIADRESNIVNDSRKSVTKFPSPSIAVANHDSPSFNKSRGSVTTFKMPWKNPSIPARSLSPKDPSLALK